MIGELFCFLFTCSVLDGIEDTLFTLTFSCDVIIKCLLNG